MAKTDGIWLVRAGVFGPDSDIRGAAVAIENGRIIGGDHLLAYYGECRIEGTTIRGTVHVVRHGEPDYTTFFGSFDNEYIVEFVGERVRRDYYEGHLKVLPDIEGRMFMFRMADLPERREN
jgi:hypothetical protein